MFTLENHGSLVLVRPLDTDAREWLAANTGGRWFGGALAVEPRFVENLLVLLDEAGFEMVDEVLA